MGVHVPICLSLWGLDGERIDGSEDGGGQRADSQVWCHVGPTHDPTCIDQDGRGERDIVAVMTVSVAQPVGGDGVQVGIGEDRKLEPRVAAQLGVGLDRIHDHADDAHAAALGRLPCSIAPGRRDGGVRWGAVVDPSDVG